MTISNYVVTQSAALVSLRGKTLPSATEPQRAALRTRIKALLKKQDATLVAHYYAPEDIQRLADETGGCVSDSLEMARFGARQSATTLVVAGVRFMGETAKILNPEKRVLMPNLGATCSLDLGCPIDRFSAFCDQHPDRVVVVYANTSAAVKARADWVVTSAIALDVIEHLDEQGKKILWAPDRHLGAYLREKTGADMLLWDAGCIVHEEFKARELNALKALYPDAAILVHPEAPAAVVRMAHVVGSTTALINAAKTLPNKTLIVATDRGIFHKMRQAAPGKVLLEAPTGGAGAACKSCAACPWMAMNDLESLAHTLEHLNNEIFVEETIRQRALVPLQRMLDFATSIQRPAVTTGRA